ncbi:TadE/TadG family type IV pilus assembly protein [uncultured Microbacterium sp.]|uniref:TadE/TadG family type IV pilus assembly protein n=1 Tax=uncultured Microbacterium sp. TaxID=191216 RepID=UPI0028D20C39|nr:TadE/TadG family type IV pilus assembly protein [uncultured Microbacterium sp.]
MLGLGRVAGTRVAPGAVSGDRGSSPVEFVLVGTLLTVLTLGAMQLALAVYVRNVVHDAAVEGAYVGALADTTLADGADRARAVITRAVGASYAEDISVVQESALGAPTVRVTITSPLPVIGLLGPPHALTVEADAPKESFGEG